MRVIFVTVFVVFFDQITKFLVKGISLPFLNINIEGMGYAESIDVIGSFFRLTFVENPGMAFGIDVGGTSKLFLSLFSLAASIGIFIYLLKVKNQRYIVRVALALILGGAIGNLIDRTFYGIFYDYAPLFYGKVVDFFNVDFFDFTIFGRTYERWPIFNIADSAVTIGVFLILIFNREPESKSKEEEVNESLDNPGSEAPDDIVNDVKEKDTDYGEDNNREENSNRDS
ncbi:MAG: signal peptidase II [Bacteroidetes bacterium]|nr:signal peptidase II [Bacteroidota bacterium]